MTQGSSVVLGYHGCDRAVGVKAIDGSVQLAPSAKAYDWLGPGVYFWENDPQRALEWAREKAAAGSYAQPFVVGAAIDLGHCLDLTLRDDLDLLRLVFDDLKRINKASGLPMPRNKDPRSKTRGDKLLRFLDCAVLTHLHALLADPKYNQPGSAEYLREYDTVRGLFVEGRPVYPGSGFYGQSHTQIAVVKPSNIKGLFKPRP